MVKKIAKSPSSYSGVSCFNLSIVARRRYTPRLSAKMMAIGWRKTKIIRRMRNGVVRAGTSSHRYTSRKKNGSTKLRGVMWLIVCAKKPGTIPARNAPQIERRWFFVSLWQRRYAGKTIRLANMFGNILRTACKGIKSPKNARIAS